MFVASQVAMFHSTEKKPLKGMTEANIARLTVTKIRKLKKLNLDGSIKANK